MNSLRLDHHAIAGGEDAGERREGQVEREIPRADDADDALGLVFDISLGAEQVQRKRSTLRFSRFIHLREVLLGVLQRADRAATSVNSDWWPERWPKSSLSASTKASL